MKTIAIAGAMLALAASIGVARAENTWTARPVFIGMNYWPDKFDAGNTANGYCGATGHWRAASYRFESFTPKGPNNYGTVKFSWITCLLPEQAPKHP